MINAYLPILLSCILDVWYYVSRHTISINKFVVVGDAKWTTETGYNKVPSANYQGAKSGFPGKEYISSMMDFANRSLLVSKAFYFFFFAAFGSLFPLLGVYFKQLGINPTQCGFLIGMRPFIEFCSAPFWGSMADRWKKGKLILLCSVFSWILFTIIVAFIKPPADSCIRFNHTHLILVPPYLEQQQTGRYRRSIPTSHMQLHHDVLLDNEAIESINQMYNSGHSLPKKRVSEQNNKKEARTNKKVENSSNSSDASTPVMTEAPSTLFETNTMQQEEDTTVPPPLPPTKKPTSKPKITLYKEPEDIPR